MPWGAVWRQSRRDAVPLAVGGLVVAAAAFGSAAAPLVLASVAGSTVRAEVAEAVQPAEVVISVPSGSGYQGTDPAGAAAAVRELLDAGLPAELRHVLAEPVTALVGPELKAGVIAERPGRVRFVYLASRGGPGTTWVEGRAPAAITGAGQDWLDEERKPPVEVAVSEAGAAVLGVRAGARLTVDSPTGVPLDVRLSGVYRAEDPADAAWQVAPTLLKPQLVDGSAALASLSLLVSAESLPAAELDVVPTSMTRTFTYPVAAERLDAERAAVVATQARALASGRRTFEVTGMQPIVTTRLDRLIDAALARVAAATAQASVLLLGLLAAALLVEFLAAGLVTERRGRVIAQWRARGATLPAIALANAAEAGALTAVAGAIGVGAAAAVVGGVPPPGWILPPLVAAVVPQPLLATLVAARASAPPDPRGGLPAARLRRTAAEGTLVLLALAALGTLVVRGATASAGTVWTDGVVLAAPVLVALVAALGLVRLQPRLTVVARATAARRPGVVALLAAARARANAPAAAALVVASAVAAIAASAGATVAQGRTDAAWDAVGADAAVTTSDPAGLPAEVAGLDGTEGLTATTAAVIPRAQLLGSGLDRPVRIVAVDAEALARLLAVTPAADAPVLGELGARGSAAVPVLASGLPAWDTAGLRWGEESVRVRPVGVAPRLPVQLGVEEDTTIVVDRFALAEALGHEVPASLAWVNGPGAPKALTAALAGASARVTTREGWLQQQSSAPLPLALDRLLTGALVGAVALAALAVVLMAASGAAERTRAAGLLRVVGTPRASAGRVAWLEATVPALVASVVGVAVGILLAGPLVGALDLSSITGGRQAPRLVVAWWGFGIPPALAAVAGAAVAVAGAARRREPLGELMRAG